MSVPTPDPEWLDDAACRGMDVNLFFPQPNEHDKTRQALAACARCPVTAECLADAETSGEHRGIRGGLTVTQRDRLRYTHRPIRHGTPYAYSKRACRCDLCRAAGTRYKQAWLAAKRTAS